MTKPLVVFGAAVHAGGVPSPTLQRRCNAAIAHWRTGQFDCLVPSGGLGRHGPTEASVMAALFRDAGIDDNNILKEDAATTTFETAHYVQALFADQSVERFFLVTDRYHLLRARLAFAAFGLPSASVNASGHPPASAQRQTAWQWLRELPGTAYYAWKCLAQRLRG